MTIIDRPAAESFPLEIAREPQPSDLEDLVAQRTFPCTWYLVCLSTDIPSEKTHSIELLGHPIVLFRTKAGTLHALDAHCPHMGTHMGGGAVVNDCLRCPLHHWSFEGDGHCKTPAPTSANLRQKSWPVTERFGVVFVYFGDEADAPLPSFESTPESSLATIAGKAVTLRCSWIAISSNSYDIVHLNAVHERALREPPLLERLDRFRLRLRYLSRVTGTGLSDRVMKWLSKDHIRVSITCWGGTVFTVESHAGPSHSMLVIGATPVPEGVRLVPVFAMKKSAIPGLTRLRLTVARWLFMRFLEKDMSSLQDMRFKPPQTHLPAEQTLQQFFDYVTNLPTARP
jgi:phenylpropionate dioxygenase-like ring-hydroxylating dioxygenase large terminal subunit